VALVVVEWEEGGQVDGLAGGAGGSQVHGCRGGGGGRGGGGCMMRVLSGEQAQVGLGVGSRRPANAGPWLGLGGGRR
jgi:hypothetical protein